jgi:branched-chain amino acid transport system permease protein
MRVGKAGFALLSGHGGATFASTRYSILPLLHVLLGGAGRVIGPVLCALLMVCRIDLSSSVTTAHRIVVGAALVLLVLFAPKGILGTLRDRAARWLP